jgi:hypothetical protein
LLLVFLWWHWDLGIHRYFDVDEYAHLHWASRFVAGKRPYIDFLYFFPPGFLWFLAPIFWWASGTAPLIAGRVLAFFIFLSLTFVTIATFWSVRRSYLAVIAGVFLAFLPLPFDRYLDIRPDNLATLLVFLGLFFQLRFLRNRARRDGLLAGLWYGASLVTLTKTLPQILFALLVSLVAQHTYIRKNGVNGLKNSAMMSIRKNMPLIIGFSIPVALFLLWVLYLGDIGTTVYSLTKLPFEANRISQFFIMQPDLFFYPNEILYGSGGYNQGLLGNHIIWGIGLLFGIYRFFTPFLTRGKNFLWEEVLLAGTFVVHIIIFVLFIPLKHTQYLIPIGVLVSFFAADAVCSIWYSMRKSKVGRIAFTAGWVIAGLILYRTFIATVTPKRIWTNDMTLSKAQKIWDMIPTSEYVLDLDGLMFYYPDPYYACCVPFGQFAQFLTRPLPSLAATLEESQTKYIYQGGLKRISTLEPADQAYIAAHYRPVDTDGDLFVRK